MSVHLWKKEDQAFGQALLQLYRQEEQEVIQSLLEYLDYPSNFHEDIAVLATEFIEHIRSQKKHSYADRMMKAFDLATPEGRALMSLAESLLRIPDAGTATALIADKMAGIDWWDSSKDNADFRVKASGLGLDMAKHIFGHATRAKKGVIGMSAHILAKVAEPVARLSVHQAIEQLGQHFVLATNMSKAFARCRTYSQKGYTFSFDMLGEGARTKADADRYFKAYQEAIQILKKQAGSGLHKNPGISVKLSALHPRYTFAQKETVYEELVPMVLTLAQQAKEANIGMTIDAEETDRLDISLEIMQRVFLDSSLAEWEGFGFALQAYQKRAFAVVDWAIALSKEGGKKITIRLVKGAYWDTEIKRAQEQGLDYPVFTRKANTDVSYLACAQKMLAYPEAIYGQFATHNAYTIAAIMKMAEKHPGGPEGYEFQRLHGMGEVLHDLILEKYKLASRMYAPVGGYKDLLAYLVRRLLENGANTSFVKALTNPNITLASLLRNPVDYVQNLDQTHNVLLPEPKDLYGPARLNAAGIDLSIPYDETIVLNYKQLLKKQNPLKNGVAVRNPAYPQETLGYVALMGTQDLTKALDKAHKAFSDWDQVPMMQRASILRKVANAMEGHMETLLNLCILEAGKTMGDAVAEAREAIDFCRYYAHEAEQLSDPRILTGSTGEYNALSLRGRGVFLCISPWNFPLAIFTGQVAAALVMGNTVLAKPSFDTPLMAQTVADIFHEADIPKDVLQLITARGADVSKAFLHDNRLRGIAFTGSGDTARQMQQDLAKRTGPMVTFIAETAGLNAMIVDSSALLETVVDDVITSAFRSAGQRCSALRILAMQEDIADDLLKMLTGAMQDLRIGDPIHLSTDIGPVINAEAKKKLEKHVKDIQQKGAKILYACPLPEELPQEAYMAPHLISIKRYEDVQAEAFGPILHVLRYKRKDLDKLIDSINASNYGLTLGVHTRINSFAQYIRERAHVGNIYVNRNMIGAVVGVQPFGGEGLSGTGPKAGGPNYLPRFATERVYTENLTAMGGNTQLLLMGEG